jgi:hypothetical protein
MSPFALLGASPTDDQVGRALGQVFLGALLLAGFLKSWSRKPNVNSLCAASLSIVLGGWLAALALSVAIQWIERFRSLYFVGAWAVVSIFAGGIVSGILGLVDRRKDPLRGGGRGRALGALGLGAIFLALFSFGLAQRMGQGTGGYPVPPDGAATAGSTMVFEEFNLRYRVPEESYVSLDAKKINRDATFGLMRRDPRVMLMVIAERVPGATVTSQGLAEISKGNLKTVARNVRISGDAPRRINGVDGQFFYTDAEVGGKGLTYVHWAAAHNGYFYQFIAWGEPERREEVHREAEMLFSRFELIDPNRRAGDGAKGAPRYPEPAEAESNSP